VNRWLGYLRDQPLVRVGGVRRGEVEEGATSEEQGIGKLTGDLAFLATVVMLIMLYD